MTTGGLSDETILKMSAEEVASLEKNVEHLKGVSDQIASSIQDKVNILKRKKELDRQVEEIEKTIALYERAKQKAIESIKQGASMKKAVEGAQVKIVDTVRQNAEYIFDLMEDLEYGDIRPNRPRIDIVSTTANEHLRSIMDRINIHEGGGGGLDINHLINTLKITDDD